MSNYVREREAIDFEAHIVARYSYQTAHLKEWREVGALNVPLHVHRDFHAAITRNPNHGVSMLVFAKLARLAGGDQLHTGTAVGKMQSAVDEVLRVNRALTDEWHDLKTVFPVASGGVYPGVIEANLRVLGRDIVLQAGGGVTGHPLGTRAGAKAMVQAVEAAIGNVPPGEYAKSHRELKLALDKWPTPSRSGGHD